ncbi:MarR family winged helix-turn-helix transcriptional regulator [Arsenicicoccus sp. oral taxon 190]|uniref:MarR family winged helix-turn-helix transcriptional regulator n=1 Tax=Arsenicicoccus sp. oral taxon 190 TaxID=1658671 RepID=UPI0009E4D1D8|nr:MarR family transcriptional regulator [Arsenicicoccus sp. oral taxon 190]
MRWLSATEQVAWRAYLRGQRLLEVALDKDLQAHGVSLSEYEILSMLSEQPGRRQRMSELAALVVQSRSRLTHTANRLEGRGWVERHPVPGDGRGVELVLTEAGFAALVEMAPVHVESVRRHWLDALPPELVTALGDAMARVRDDLGTTQQQRAEADRIARG